MRHSDWHYPLACTRFPVSPLDCSLFPIYPLLPPLLSLVLCMSLNLPMADQLKQYCLAQFEPLFLFSIDQTRAVNVHNRCFYSTNTERAASGHEEIDTEFEKKSIGLESLIIPLILPRGTNNVILWIICIEL